MRKGRVWRWPPNWNQICVNEKSGWILKSVGLGEGEAWNTQLRSLNLICFLSSILNQEAVFTLLLFTCLWSNSFSGLKPRCSESRKKIHLSGGLTKMELTRSSSWKVPRTQSQKNSGQAAKMAEPQFSYLFNECRLVILKVPSRSQLQWLGLSRGCARWEVRGRVREDTCLDKFWILENSGTIYSNRKLEKEADF